MVSQACLWIQLFREITIIIILIIILIIFLTRGINDLSVREIYVRSKQVFQEIRPHPRHHDH